jgi:hypothetical protein
VSAECQYGTGGPNTLRVGQVTPTRCLAERGCSSGSSSDAMPEPTQLVAVACTSLQAAATPMPSMEPLQQQCCLPTHTALLLLLLLPPLLLQGLHGLRPCRRKSRNGSSATAAVRWIRTPGLPSARPSYTWLSLQNFWISGSRTTEFALRLKSVTGSVTVAE